ncbi:MAG TPA: flagellar assembly protein FliH [Steroidobacteraceae bacterium]|nr:flagellar assembly protein FliH [Steroidobacteraceae bacterium]
MLQTEEGAGFALSEPTAWQAPVIDGMNGWPGGRRMGIEQLREEQRRILAEAEAAGRAAGLAAAQKEIEARRRELEARARSLQVALDALARPLAQVDDQVHEQIALLAVQLARGLVRRELRTEPSQVIGIVRDTVALLPASTQGVRVALHPEDAALVRERLAVDGPEPAWSIIDDPALARGDCRIYTDYAQIDARIDTRLKEALAALLGDERLERRGETA